MSERKDKGTLTWTDLRGKERVRPFNYTLDIRDLIGRPGFAWALLAANPQLSNADIGRLLDCFGPKMQRGRGWISRHVWMFRPEDAKPEALDPTDEKAIEILRANPTKSSGQLVYLLKEAGISRSRDWVWRHRCD